VFAAEAHNDTVARVDLHRATRSDQDPFGGSRLRWVCEHERLGFDNAAIGRLDFQSIKRGTRDHSDSMPRILRKPRGHRAANRSGANNRDISI
jgi:hypothetical protein